MADFAFLSEPMEVCPCLLKFSCKKRRPNIPCSQSFLFLLSLLLRCQSLQVRIFVFVVAFLALFEFPAFYRLLKRFVFICGKKISDVRVVLKLFFDFSLAVSLFFFQNLMIGGDCVLIGFSGVRLQPFLKSHVERKTFSDLFLEECTVLFAANKVFFYCTVRFYFSGSRFSARLRFPCFVVCSCSFSAFQENRNPLGKFALASGRLQAVFAAKIHQFFF